MPPAMMNWTPRVQELVGWYNGYQEKIEADTYQHDEGYAIQSEEALREEWKGDFRANMNVVSSFLQSGLSAEAMENLDGARGGDGKPLMSNPEILKFLASKGRELNPIASVITDTAATRDNLESRIKEIEDKMGTVEYEQDEKMQEELRGLYDARERAKGQQTG